MGLAAWAIKSSELRPLSDAGLLLFAARCAMRIEPWRPAGMKRLWSDGLSVLTSAARGEPVAPEQATSLRRAISNRGAIACTDIQSSDEPLGRCMNYATGALALGIDATRTPNRAKRVAIVGMAAKHAGSIPAVLAHAGRVRGKSGEDPVESACLFLWRAMRGDIPLLARTEPHLLALGSKSAVRALAAVGPLWPSRPPAWAQPALEESGARSRPPVARLRAPRVRRIT
jgi:hypothetical protein